jgi:phage-related protein
MEWKITYHNIDVEKAVLALSDTLLARYIRMTELMEIHGANLGMPHTRAIGDGLFELRLKGKEGISRIFYCTLVDKKIRMLHAIIKKTEKTPNHEVTIARKRLKEVKSHEKKNA